jgi:hypothetical protein
MVLPSGQTADSILSVATPGAAVPSWAYQTTFAGGPAAAAGGSGQAVIQLTEGDWVIWNGGEAKPAPHALTVTAATGTVTAPSPTAGVDVTEQEYSFLGLDNPVPAGEQLWKITNTGKQPHFMDIVKLPEGTTQQQLMEAINGFLMGTPVAGGLDLSQVADVAGTSTLSPGQTMLAAFDLAPGTYGVACFFPDIQGGTPHALLGMVVVFTVQ